jgi:hypothetical protein
MKITRIQAQGVLGLKEVDATLPTPVALFAGRNGSGKSSIQEAVRMAITQDTVRDVSTKKTYGMLVHEGATAGGAVVTIDGDADQSFAFNMPKGEFVGPEISEPMRVALYGQRFAKMTADERRTFLFGLTGLKPKADNVKARMLARGCQEAKVDAVLPLLRTGFPGVCEHAKGKATEAKGAWRQLTGETYGAVKAASWEAPVPDLPPGDVQKLADQVAGIDRNIALLNENLGRIKSVAIEAQKAAQRREALADGAGKVASLTDQLARRAPSWPSTAEGGRPAQARQRHRPGRPGARHGQVHRHPAADREGQDRREGDRSRRSCWRPTRRNTASWTPASPIRKRSRPWPSMNAACRWSRTA